MTFKSLLAIFFVMFCLWAIKIALDAKQKDCADRGGVYVADACWRNGESI